MDDFKASMKDEVVYCFLPSSLFYATIDNYYLHAFVEGDEEC